MELRGIPSAPGPAWSRWSAIPEKRCPLSLLKPVFWESICACCGATSASPGRTCTTGPFSHGLHLRPRCASSIPTGGSPSGWAKAAGRTTGCRQTSLRRGGTAGGSGAAPFAGATADDGHRRGPRIRPGGTLRQPVPGGRSGLGPSRPMAARRKRASGSGARLAQADRAIPGGPRRHPGRRGAGGLVRAGDGDPIVLDGYGEGLRKAHALRWRRTGFALLGTIGLLLLAIAITPTLQLRERALEAARSYAEVAQRVEPVVRQRESLMQSAEKLTQLSELVLQPHRAPESARSIDPTAAGRYLSPEFPAPGRQGHHRRHDGERLHPHATAGQ